jgi:hypothetical protein
MKVIVSFIFFTACIFQVNLLAQNPICPPGIYILPIPQPVSGQMGNCMFTDHAMKFRTVIAHGGMMYCLQWIYNPGS